MVSIGAGDLGRELLALYALAISDSSADFEQAAVRKLSRLVGFNGAVWGVGTKAPTSGKLEIQQAHVIDRPTLMVSEFAQLPCSEPVSGAFMRRPNSPIVVSTNRFYRGRKLAPVRDYLLAYDVGHLMVVGQRCPLTGVLSWITVYRSVNEPAFDRGALSTLLRLLPHWVQAKTIRSCLGKQDAVLATPAASFAWDMSNSEQANADLLTERQREVLALLSVGLSYRSIASELGISTDTVKEHASRIYQRLGATNRAQALCEARTLGIQLVAAPRLGWGAE